MKEAQELKEPTEQYFAQPLDVSTISYAFFLCVSYQFIELFTAQLQSCTTWIFCVF